MQYNHIISLGGRCEVSFNIRRRYVGWSKNYFDWLITPFESMLALISRDLEDDFSRGDLVLRASRFSVDNMVSGVRHLHDFQRDTQNRIPRDALTNDYDKMRAKYDWLGVRWRTTLASGEPILFIVQHEVPQDRLDTLNEVLRGKVAGPYHLLCVRPPRLKGDYVDRPGLSHGFAPKTTNWRGDPAAWDLLLRRFELATPEKAQSAVG